MIRLPFSATASSSAPHHSPSNLESLSKHSLGWISQPGLSPPHWLQFNLTQPHSSLDVIQILAHETKIPARIDVFVDFGDGHNKNSKQFELAGFVDLDDNSRTEYHARELISVDLQSIVLGRPVRSIKFVMNSAHAVPSDANNRNSVSAGQVGIMGLNLLGHFISPSPSSSPLSSVGATTSASSITSHRPALTAGNSPMYTSQIIQLRVQELRQLKESAAAREAYDDAKLIRTEEQRLQQLLGQAAELEAQKAQAVSREDYDEAKRIKGRLDALQQMVLADTQQQQHNLDEKHHASSSSPSRPIRPLAGSSNAEHAWKTSPATAPQPPTAGSRAGMMMNTTADDDDAATHSTANGTSSDFGNNNAPPPGFWGDLDPDSTFPTAEPLSGPRDENLISSLGEYLVRSLKSSHIKLRQAALAKIERDVRQATEYSTDDAEAVLQAVIMGLSDAAPHVFVSASRLFDAIVQHVVSNITPQPTSSTSALDNAAGGGEIITMDLIVEHAQHIADCAMDALGSAHQIVIDAANTVLVKLSELPNSESILAKSLFRPIGTSSSKNWKALHGRLLVLTRQLTLLGASSTTRKPTIRNSPAATAAAAAGQARAEYNLDRVFDWAARNEVFQHSNASVREAARNAMIALHGSLDAVDAVRLESLLRGALRPNVLDTYLNAFHHQGGAARNTSSASTNKPAAPTSTAPTSTAISSDEETCEFCGIRVPTEDALVIDGEQVSAMDRHHWQDCPMLTTCTRCEQVCLISNLNDHLLTECEMRANHRPCPRCGEAIAAQFFQQHVARARCLPQQPLPVANRCPLCHLDVEPFESGWAIHLLGNGCPKNPRTVISGQHGGGFGGS